MLLIKYKAESEEWKEEALSSISNGSPNGTVASLIEKQSSQETKRHLLFILIESTHWLTLIPKYLDFRINELASFISAMQKSSEDSEKRFKDLQ